MLLVRILVDLPAQRGIAAADSCMLLAQVEAPSYKGERNQVQEDRYNEVYEAKEKPLVHQGKLRTKISYIPRLRDDIKI